MCSTSQKIGHTFPFISLSKRLTGTVQMCLLGYVMDYHSSLSMLQIKLYNVSPDHIYKGKCLYLFQMATLEDIVKRLTL